MNLYSLLYWFDVGEGFVGGGDWVSSPGDLSSSGLLLTSVKILAFTSILFVSPPSILVRPPIVIGMQRGVSA